MEYKSFYKTSGRIPQDHTHNTSVSIRSHRDSKRHDLFVANRNITLSNTPELAAPPKDIKGKENKLKNKRVQLLQRLKDFKELRAKKKEDEKRFKKQAFISAVPKNTILDNSYERNLYKSAATPKISNKLTPAKRPLGPRFDTGPNLSNKKKLESSNKNTIHIIKTPSSIKHVKAKVDSRRKFNKPFVAVAQKEILKETYLNIIKSKKNILKTDDAVFLLPSQVQKTEKLRSTQKSATFNFNKDGSFLTSTNRKSSKSVKPAKINISEIKKDDLFDGISPIEVNTPLKDGEKVEKSFVISKRDSKRKTKFPIPEPAVPIVQVQQETSTKLSKATSPVDKHDNEEDKKTNSTFELPGEGDEPKRNESYTIVIDSDSDDSKGVDKSPAKIKRISCGRQSLIFVEMDKNLPVIADPETKRLSTNKRNSMFKEEDAPPPGVEAKAIFYHNLVTVETQRLQDLSKLYQSDFDNQDLDDNSRGLILAAQGQSNILINKKLSKFKSLIDHYALQNDQKVRFEDLDGFWDIVESDLSNLNARFDKLKTLKENNWREQEDEAPKIKKIRGGGGIKKRVKIATKSTGIADLIKKAREEKRRMIELSKLENVTVVVTPNRRSVRIAVTPKSNRRSKSFGCTGCTPKEKTSCRKDLFQNVKFQPAQFKSILKTPGEKKNIKSVLFLDGVDTPETTGTREKVFHTPKPKLNFVVESDDESIGATPKMTVRDYKRRRSSTKFQRRNEESAEEQSSGIKTRRSGRKTVSLMPSYEDSPLTSLPSKRICRSRGKDKVSFA